VSAWIAPYLGMQISPRDMVPLVVVLLALFLLMSSLRRRQQRRGRQEAHSSPQRPGPAPASQEQQLRRDLEALLVELQELSRKISAQIDTRFAKLEAVIRDADRRIAVLERLNRQAGAKTGTIPGETPSSDIRHTAVYELADTGRTPVEIAKELGKTPGEVELILNLRNQGTITPPRQE